MQNRLTGKAVQLWSSGVAGAEGTEGTLGPHGTADLPIVQAEWTGQNPYFTTKNLETNCKLEDLTTPSPKDQPGSSSTSCPSVLPSPSSSRVKGQFSPACEAALLLAIPTQPACKHFPVRGLAFISQKFQAHWQVVRQRQQDGFL